MLKIAYGTHSYIEINIHIIQFEEDAPAHFETAFMTNGRGCLVDVEFPSCIPA